jgi:hypothetical protein
MAAVVVDAAGVTHVALPESDLTQQVAGEVQLEEMADTLAGSAVEAPRGSGKRWVRSMISTGER